MKKKPTRKKRRYTPRPLRITIAQALVDSGQEETLKELLKKFNLPIDRYIK